jgi:hypothetical protein
MSGKLIGIILLGLGLIAGAAMYWLQVYAFYDEVTLAGDGGTVEMRITTADGTPVPLPVQEFRGIDADSSPIRFRACFTAALPQDAVLQEVDDAVPLNAPGWFDCFDAAAIGADLASGAAEAWLGETNVIYGIDRILALYPDGRGFAWHQINACGEEVFDGRPAPAGCPPPPVRTE